MNKKFVYVVRQTQPVAYYDEKAIAVFDNKESALELSRRLNRKFGYGVRFDENYDYIESDDDYDYDDQHYYDIDIQKPNPNIEDFFLE